MAPLRQRIANGPAAIPPGRDAQYRTVLVAMQALIAKRRELRASDAELTALAAMTQRLQTLSRGH